MPVMGGMTLTTNLRQLTNKHFYIILASAEEDYYDQAQLFDMILEKPINMAIVLETHKNIYNKNNSSHFR